MNGAIVHDWIELRGGSERVVDALVDAFPESDIFTLWNNAPHRYPGHVVSESWLAASPLRGRKGLAVPLALPTWRRFRAPRPYNWVLVSSHSFAHHFRFRDAHARNIPKFVYAHTPPRYVWEPELDPRGASPVARLASAAIRRLDLRRAQEPIAIAANSAYIRERIRRVWNRDSTVIYPPVDVLHIQAMPDWSTQLTSEEGRLASSLPGSFLLGASRFVRYKRLDQVIRLGERVGLPVVIAGSGPEEAQLRERAQSATVPVHFVLSPSAPLLFTLYQRSMCYIFPPIEDFGIMPVEAMAAGAKVIVNCVGGASESVRATQGGASVPMDDDMASASDAVDQISRCTGAADHEALESFDRSEFVRRVRDWVDLKFKNQDQSP